MTWTILTILSSTRENSCERASVQRVPAFGQNPPFPDHAAPPEHPSATHGYAAGWLSPLRDLLSTPVPMSHVIQRQSVHNL